MQNSYELLRKKIRSLEFRVCSRHLWDTLQDLSYSFPFFTVVISVEMKWEGEKEEGERATLLHLSREDSP